MKNQIYQLNVPRSLRSQRWMRDLDFRPFFSLLIWVTGLKVESPIFEILLKRISKMYHSQGKRKNLRFVHSYLKECYTISLAAMVGSSYSPKMGVAVGKVTGFPLLIPGRLRKRMLTERRIYVAVMTLLGIHRIIPWWPKVSFATIEQPFNGKVKTFALEALRASKQKLCELAKCKRDLRFDKLTPSTFLTRGRGPNSKVAYLGVLDDATAILLQPDYAFSLIKWFYLLGSYGLILSLFGIWVFYSIPLSLICKVWSHFPVGRLIRESMYIWWVFWDLTFRPLFVGFKVHIIMRRRSMSAWWWISPYSRWNRIRFRWYVRWLRTFIGKMDTVNSVLLSWLADPSVWEFTGSRDLIIGRLSVVFNTAGKSRVIGITNWWTQIALYPLHKEIFRFLRRLPTDGTFDQLAPIRALEGDRDREYRSYDLSAATDRLPRDLQRDILSLFVDPRLADIWSKLVDIPFGYRDRDGSLTKDIRYSVGQPMGAYSSWAMLALTHHFVVQLSSPVTARRYAVLGDDVVIKHDEVPDYLSNMRLLGVEISLPKSIIHNEFVEFAKRVKQRNGLDYSIIGPGLIMSAVRERWLAVIVLCDAVYKHITDELDIPQLLEKVPGLLKDKEFPQFGVLALYGPNGLLSSNLTYGLDAGKVRVLLNDKRERLFSGIKFSAFLEKEMKRKWINAKEQAHNTLNSLKFTLWEASFSGFHGHIVGVKTDGTPNVSFWSFANVLRVLLGIITYLTFWLSPIPYICIRDFGANLEIENPWVSDRFDVMYIDDRIAKAFAAFPELQLGDLEELTNREAARVRSFYDRLSRFRLPNTPFIELGFKPNIQIKSARPFGPIWTSEEIHNKPIRRDPTLF